MSATTNGIAIPITSTATLYVDGNAMNAWVEWASEGCDMDALSGAVQATCTELGIQVTQGAPVATLLAAGVALDEHRFKAAVASGTPPLPPIHGRLEFTSDFFQQGFAVDPITGQLDYRRRVSRCNVDQGQLLARLFEPKDGEPGVDVYGRTVAPEKGRRTTIRVGANVRADETGSLYCADRAGRIRWAHNVLAVDEVLVVHGSIGLETGNVRHPGALQIEQDIEDGAEVEADGDIEVHGVIENAVVRAGGNVIVHGGIAGDKKCRVVAGGAIRARFVLNAELESGGNVEVEREIDNSIVRCRGAVLIPQGRIAGGSIMARSGVAAGQLGTDASVFTEVATGVDYKIAEELDAFLRAIEPLEAEHKRVSDVVDAATKAVDRLSPQQREMLTVIMMNQATLRQNIESQRQQILDLEAESIARLKFNIVVQSRLCPDVLLRVGTCHLRTTQETRGPVRISQRDGEVEIFPIAMRSARTETVRASA